MGVLGVRSGGQFLGCHMWLVRKFSVEIKVFFFKSDFHGFQIPRVIA